jgi:hypothetical protein
MERVLRKREYLTNVRNISVSISPVGYDSVYHQFLMKYPLVHRL